MGVSKMINSILKMIKAVPEGQELSGYIYLLDGASSSIIGMITLQIAAKWKKTMLLG